MKKDVNYGSAGENAEDSRLCLCSHEGDKDAEERLLIKYSRMVRMCARPLFLAGGDGEDLIQEGMLGLLKAIRDFNPERDASFFTFALLCIRSRLYSALRQAKRAKHSPLNDYVPIEALFLDGFSGIAADSALHQPLDPEELVIGREKSKELEKSMKALLSDFEAKVLGLYLEGLSCREIAAAMNRPCKSVDNAVQRVRKKLAHYVVSLGDNR